MTKLKIKNKVRELRFHSNEMTQASLAKQTGVTRQTILALEAGRYSPSLELAFKVAMAFNVEIGDVFSVTHEPQD
ncbi:helix-turn-helix transcriptional regulator [Temperatibacter marinus]|uniref:Helix-turn-helix transcriptional regulator n=1 Tax=Temperatibacter marinus TaxID=1456591 RepID=A0AA52EAL8_9PROT|nr:helix-turn-helix transcriptional regulator [Temperatibacter marinus]WND01787.1 helix-turn-helix transcriptional regulator [Temperatibacter marinus]